MQLGDDQHGSAASCGNVVAGIDLAQANPSVNGGLDVAVGQVQIGVCDRRLVAGDGSFVRSEGCLQRVQVLLRDNTLFVEDFVALVLRFGVRQLGLVLLQVGLGLL